MVTNQRTRVKLLSDTFSEILVKGDSGEITLKPNGKLFKNQIINQMWNAKHLYKHSEIHQFYFP